MAMCNNNCVGRKIKRDKILTTIAQKLEPVTHKNFPLNLNKSKGVKSFLVQISHIHFTKSNKIVNLTERKTNPLKNDGVQK